MLVFVCDWVVITKSTVRRNLTAASSMICVKQSKMSSIKHGRVGNVVNVARAFYDEKNHQGVADILSMDVSLIRGVVALLLAVNSPKMMDVYEYVVTAGGIFAEHPENPSKQANWLVVSRNTQSRNTKQAK